MSDEKYNFGMIGLGTMGCNLVLNMSDKGFSVAGYDKDTKKVDALNKLDKNNNVSAFGDIAAFVQALQAPRTILLLVPAGPIVDAVIGELKPLLQNDDIIIDCGNSHFIDTQLRIDQLAKDNIHFMGLGVSGGETGARFGPSIMPGGDKTAYARIEDMLKAVSAKVDGEACTAYMGKGAAGHYVKMVHNGIEYALMQLISETYHILKVHGGFTNDELHETFDKWNKGRLQSFLIEITAAIFTQPDEKGKGLLIDNIADTAHQKGTGAWMSQDAMKIQSPIPAVDAAVTQRILSSMKQERVVAAKFFSNTATPELTGNKETLANDIESRGVLPLTIVGYYKAREFYAPKYDVVNDRTRADLRSTIYWQPELMTDKNGNASFDFYNADGTGQYQVIVEGINSNGTAGVVKFTYEVKE